jgi:hypothetical protein
MEKLFISFCVCTQAKTTHDLGTRPAASVVRKTAVNFFQLKQGGKPINFFVVWTQAKTIHDFGTGQTTFFLDQTAV